MTHITLLSHAKPAKNPRVQEQCVAIYDGIKLLLSRQHSGKDINCLSIERFLKSGSRIVSGQQQIFISVSENADATREQLNKHLE